MNAIGSVWRRLGEYDTSICLRVNRAADFNGVRRFFALISRLGDGVFWYALMVAMAVADGREGLQTAVHMAVVGAVGLGIYKWMKGTFVRPRPFMVVQHIRLGTAPLDLYSFPSGHTLHAAGFTLVALGYYPLLGWFLIPFALLIALSRVVLGLHYPTDVVVGGAIGAGLAALSWPIAGAI